MLNPLKWISKFPEILNLNQLFLKNSNWFMCNKQFVLAIFIVEHELVSIFLSNVGKSLQISTPRNAFFFPPLLCQIRKLNLAD